MYLLHKAIGIATVSIAIAACMYACMGVKNLNCYCTCIPLLLFFLSPLNCSQIVLAGMEKIIFQSFDITFTNEHKQTDKHLQVVSLSGRMLVNEQVFKRGMHAVHVLNL